MCGIAGIVLRGGGSDPGPALAAMAASIAHRGPDDEGFLTTSTRDGAWRVGLAHRRLSIIDVASGHQPIGNEDGSVQIVFNGEIYNFAALRDELLAHGHVFRTHSDTETIVHAYEQWGTDCVQRFRGMFAFALWDAARERLVLARDRYGKKPLFVAEREGGIVFASEIKGVLAAPGMRARADLATIRDYFAFRYVPAPATLFDGVRKLMPGTVAVWERGRLAERRYWTSPDRAPAGASDAPHAGTGAPEFPGAGTRGGDVVGAFLERLDDAVRMRMVSDVPFGAFLSGGIDSSAVVALMSRHSDHPVRTFSVGFTESQYSELGYARTIADHFRTEHTELTVSQSDLMDHLPALVRFRDAPVAEPSDIPIYLLSMRARQSVKMVLTGEGSDEILGGYPKHVFERFAPWYQGIPAPVRDGVVAPLVRALPFRFRRAKTAIATLALADRRARMARWFGAAAPDEIDALLALPAPDRFADPMRGDRDRAAALPFDVDPRNSALRSILYFDQTSWLPDNLLERGDRMTMAASIEARMPFLDHDLAAFVSGLDDTWRVRGRVGKRILRLAMARLLPRAILERPKVGFRVPVSDWFRGPMRDYLHDHLCGPDARTRDWYRPQALHRVLSEHVEGRQNHEKLLWTMLTLELWHREYL